MMIDECFFFPAGRQVYHPSVEACFSKGKLGIFWVAERFESPAHVFPSFRWLPGGNNDAWMQTGGSSDAAVVEDPW
jgi:hypothetical protein